MTNTELARKALGAIEDTSFNCRVWSSEGGKFGNSWDDYLDIDFTKTQLLYLIKERISNNEVFEGITLDPINVEEYFDSLAREGSWPDGGPTPSVNSVIPLELEALSEEIIETDSNNPAAIATMRKKLALIEDGKYTFIFTIVDGDRVCYFAENAKETIDLSSDEAIGLLWGYHKINSIFEGLCEKPFDEDLINHKAEEKGFASKYDYFLYGGESDELDGYINAWECIINKILQNTITEENIKAYLAYFDDKDNYQLTIEEWFENSKQ